MSSASMVISSSCPGGMSPSKRRLAWRRPGTVDRVAGAAPVREARHAHATLEVLAERLLRARGEAVVLALEHALRDLHQLLRRVVGEVDVVRDPRGHAGIGREELVHAVLVAGEDHDQPVAVVLHHLQEDLDRLLAVVALVLGPVQVVRLVDEQHAAVRALEHVLGLGRRVPDVLPHQVVAGDRHQVPLLDVAEPVQDLRHPQRDGRLARARVARERHVQRRRLRRQVRLAPQPVDHEQRRDLADARLDRPQRDELGVELVEHRVDLEPCALMRTAAPPAAPPRIRAARSASERSALSVRSSRSPAPRPAGRR